MEFDRVEVTKSFKKEIKKNLINYLYIEVIYLFVIFIAVYILFNEINNALNISLFGIILLCNYFINRQFYVNTSRENSKLYFNSIFNKNTLVLLGIKIKYLYIDYIIRFLCVAITIYDIRFCYLGAVIYIIDTFFYKIKSALIYRVINGENIQNDNRISMPSINFIPNYNFEAVNYPTVNTQTPINKSGEYVISLYDISLVEKKKENLEENNKEDENIYNYLAKIKYLYENPEEDLNIIQAKFMT